MPIEIVDELDKKAEGGDPQAFAQIQKVKYERGDPSADITAIQNPSKGYRYRGAFKEKPQRIARFKAEGYEVVPKEDPAAWIVEGEKGQSGKVFGDQILMRTPIENYNRRVQKARNLDRFRQESMKAETRDKINQIAREGGVNRTSRDITFDEGD